MVNNQVIFHKNFYQTYASDPAASAGRMESIIEELNDFELIEPYPATDEDILLIHTENHLQRVKNDRENVYPIALLAVGGAILASEYAMNNRPIFAVIRPPGHHASKNGYWGFCYFNNIAIAMQKLLSIGKIKRGVIIDFDLHFGDGTEDAFRTHSNILYFSGKGSSNKEFIRNLEDYLDELGPLDILGVSAGYDRHTEDWGGLLTTADYFQIGKVLSTFSEINCSGRRFAVLEGGYNHNVLGINVRSFIEGFY